MPEAAHLRGFCVAGGEKAVQIPEITLSPEQEPRSLSTGTCNNDYNGVKYRSEAKTDPPE